MYCLDLTLPTIAENLALDEALLNDADAGLQPHETLRLWHATEPFIVLGRSSRVDDEVDREFAERKGIPIFRRVSGGATILADRGCMFYGLLLSLERRPQLRMLDVAHQFVMSRLLSALQPHASQIQFDGTCDLVVSQRKVSGNSLRLVRNWMLYHGTLLLDMDFHNLDRVLRHPPREPDYRHGRPHSQFVANLNLPAELISRSLRSEWQADEHQHDIPTDAVRRLVAEKYSQASWNFQR